MMTIRLKEWHNYRGGTSSHIHDSRENDIKEL